MYKYVHVHPVSMATWVKPVSFPCRLKKDLKGLLVAHPAWYIKALLTLVKPFIRSAAHTHTNSTAMFEPVGFGIQRLAHLKLTCAVGEL